MFNVAQYHYHSTHNHRRSVARLFTLVALAVALGLLAACSPSTTAGSPTTGTTPSTTGSGPASQQATATATIGPGMLQATLSEQFSADFCSQSSGQPAGAICFSGHGAGQVQPLGNVTFARTAIYQPGGTDSCGPATTQGTLTTVAGDTISFLASGTFCRATQTATYTYTITGGTGKYQGASGKGSIQIPRPKTSTSEIETWNGTFTYQGS